MENSCELNMSSSGRNFGHCIVTWEIQNYGRALWQKNLELKTQEFSIQGPESKDTKWKLILQTESYHNSIVEELNVKIKYKEIEEKDNPVAQELTKIDFKAHLSEKEKTVFDTVCITENQKVDSRLSVKDLMFYLERSCSDGGPDRVCVDWKVYYIDINGKKCSLAHDDRIFSRKIKYGFNIGTLYDFERDFEYNSGLTTISCDMIVTDTDTNKKFYEDMSIDLYALSEDLQWAFDSQKLCDAEIKMDGKSVKAHKAMLYSHSDFFRLAFEKGSNVIELSGMKYNEVLKILEYMYSHNLKDVIGKPSVSVYEAAIQMNLNDLAAHYAPETIQVNTKIDIKKLTYPWIIHDFTRQTECISSDILQNNHDDDAAWQIHLYPKGIDGKSEYISITAERIDGTISNDLCVQCAVLRNNEKLSLWKNLQMPKDKNTVFQDTEFILREDVFKLLNNDTLRLGFKVRTLSGGGSSLVKTPCSPVWYSMKKSFENMTENMSFLRKSSKYTDVTFYVREKKIKAHKFILSARSLMFCETFEEDESDHLRLKYTRPEIFEILLDYVYSATFKVSDIETAIEVYKSAVELVIPRLQEKCSRFLQKNVTVKNALRIFRFATEQQDIYLKETSQEFINANADEIGQQDVMGAMIGNEVTEKNIESAACIIELVRDSELAETSLTGNANHTKQNGKNSPRHSPDITERKKASQNTVTECSEVHSVEDNKSSKDSHDPVVYPVSPSQPTLIMPLKKTYGIGSSDNIFATKARDKLQDNGTTYVHIDSKGNEIKDPSPYKDLKLSISDTKLPAQIKKKVVNDLHESMQLCLKSLQECQEEFDAEIAKKKKKESDVSRQKALEEQSESKLKSNVDPNESRKESSKLDTVLSELHGNSQELSDEQSGKNLKSNASHNDSHNKGVKSDTFSSDFHENCQESSYKQNEKNLKSAVAQNESSKKCSKPDAALRELHVNGEKSFDKQSEDDLQSNAAREKDA